MSRVATAPRSTNEANWVLFRQQRAFDLTSIPPDQLFTKYSWQTIGTRGFNILQVAAFGYLLALLYREEGLSPYHAATIKKVARAMRFIGEERKREGGSPLAFPKFRFVQEIF